MSDSKSKKKCKNPGGKPNQNLMGGSNGNLSRDSRVSSNGNLSRGPRVSSNGNLSRDPMESPLVHPVPPLFNSDSRVLILGSFPSPKSREGRFFYHHRQNRFWRVIAELTGSELPETIEEKKSLILDNGFALWDVIQSCRITGASDSSIRDVTPADLSVIFNSAPIEKVYANGDKANKLYMKYIFPKFRYPITKLPSTSPANASWNLERLIDAWSVIIK